jgi:hypothetical protein
MSHDASPTGREPAEGYAGAGSPWAALPDSDEPGNAEGKGTTRARASVPQARGSASVQSPSAQDEPGDWQAPSQEQTRPGPFPPAGPTPPAPPVSGSASVPTRPAGSAQVPGAPPTGHAQVSPSAGYPQVQPPTGPSPVSPPAGYAQVQPPAGQAQVPPSAGRAQVSPAAGYAQVQPPTGQAQVPPGGSFPGFATPGQPTTPDAQPPTGTASVPGAYGASPDRPGQEYGGHAQVYGQPPQGYGSPGAYPGQGYEDMTQQVSREAPTGVYGTPSGPPAQDYHAQGYDPQAYQPTGQHPAAGYDDPTRPADAATDEPAGKNKRLLLVLALVGLVVVLAAVGTAVTLALRGSSTSYAINDCVKQDGSNAVKASCSDGKAYVVTRKVNQQSECPDANQPYVVIEHKGGKSEVLCLRPASQR